MRILMVLALILMAATLFTLGWLVRSGLSSATPGEPADSYPTEEVAYVPPKHYLCYRAQSPPRIDGRLDDKAWEAAPWTDDFVDIEGDAKPRPRFRTRAKMLWDDQYFYIGAELEEPHVWATLKQHDAVIFADNDFEVFINPKGDNHEYYEFEMNALNTGWDLFLPRPYRDDGQALDGWEIRGLKTAVHIDGTLNDPSDTDKGWSLEIAFPWKVLREMAYKRALPRAGDQWRVNFSRVEWRHKVVNGKYRKVPKTKEDNWVWSPQGAVNMHMPEKWGYVQFTDAPPGKAVFQPDPTGPVRQLLHRIYYAQKNYYQEHRRWAGSFRQLGLGRLRHDSLTGPPRLEVTTSSFEATAVIRLPGGKKQSWHIRQDSRIWTDRP